MAQPLTQSQMSTPDNIKTSKATPYRSTGIAKTLLTPCRRLGLSRKIKITPTTHNQNSPNTSTISSSSTPLAALKIQVTPTVTPSPKQNEKPYRKRAIGGSRRANIQSRFKIEDVETPVISNWTVDENECMKSFDANECKRDENEFRKLCDTNERKRDDKKLKHKKLPQKKNKSNSSDVVSCVNLKGDESEKDTHQQLCLKLDPPTKSENKEIEPKNSNINAKLNTESKKFNRRLSMKKNSGSQGELTDMDDLLSTPKTGTSSLLSGEFLKECNVAVDRMIASSEESGEQTKVVPHKKRCIVYSSDEDDFVPSQNSLKKEENVSQKLEDEDWYAKVVEIKKRIKLKEAGLAGLKQAAVYKRLHNVKELEKSIKMWKKCCEEGLMHLLPKLQEHGQIEMATLMKNVNVPNSVVYDTNTDSFM